MIFLPQMMLINGRIYYIHAMMEITGTIVYSKNIPRGRVITASPYNIHGGFLINV